MKKIAIISILIGLHFSICVAQITCKTSLDTNCLYLRMTITNLYENSPVILRADNMRLNAIETSQSLSDERKNTYIDKSKLIEATIYFYNENGKTHKNVNIRISDKELQENEIAPLDSVNCIFYCLDCQDISKTSEIEVHISIPYSTIYEKAIDGYYYCVEKISLSSLEE